MPSGTKAPVTADAIVIGGGLIGGSIAWRMAKAGAKVMVIERGEPGAEASSAAAGMLAPQGEMVEANSFFELSTRSRDLYPGFVAEVEEMSRQSVGYRRDGSLLVALDEEECRKLETLYQIQSKLGLKVERWAAETIQKHAPGLSPRIPIGVFIPGDHWLDNERLAKAVVEAGRRLGVKFLSHTPITGFNIRDSRVESVRAGLQASGLTFAADRFVLAAGCWSGELAGRLGISLSTTPCRGQMMEFETSTELPFPVRAGLHYLVPRSPGRILAGTTAEYVGYEKSVTGEGLESILKGVTRMAPLVKDLAFVRAWAGLRPDTADHLPILGFGKLENLIFATGHFRNGILLAPVTAELVTELLLTRSSSYAIEPYCPMRFG